MGAGSMSGSRRARARGEAIDVVGLGASAGGLEALEQFFVAAPIDAALAYVIVTHLDPDHATLLPELARGRGARCWPRCRRRAARAPASASCATRRAAIA